MLDDSSSRLCAQVCFRVRAMDKYLNLVRLPLYDSEAVGPKGFQAMLLGPGNNEQVQPSFQGICVHRQRQISCPPA